MDVLIQVRFVRRWLEKVRNPVDQVKPGPKLRQDQRFRREPEPDGESRSRKVVMPKKFRSPHTQVEDVQTVSRKFLKYFRPIWRQAAREDNVDVLVLRREPAQRDVISRRTHWQIEQPLIQMPVAFRQGLAHADQSVNVRKKIEEFRGSVLPIIQVRVVSGFVLRFFVRRIESTVCQQLRDNHLQLGGRVRLLCARPVGVEGTGRAFENKID